MRIPGIKRDHWAWKFNRFWVCKYTVHYYWVSPCSLVWWVVHCRKLLGCSIIIIAFILSVVCESFGFLIVVLAIQHCVSIWRQLKPRLIMQAFQTSMPFYSCPPRPSKQRSFNYATPITGNTNKNRFLGQKSVLVSTHPRPEKWFISILHV